MRTTLLVLTLVLAAGCLSDRSGSSAGSGGDVPGGEGGDEEPGDGEEVAEGEGEGGAGTDGEGEGEGGAGTEGEGEGEGEGATEGEGEGEPPHPEPPKLDWSDCGTRDWPDGYPTPLNGVECTRIEVPLDHGAPDGATLSLQVARHASRGEGRSEAVFQLAGGPGGGSVWQSGTIPLLLRGLRDRFDIVYVDQRGTGDSSPLDCPSTSPYGGSWPYTEEGWLACAEALADYDLDHFLTEDAAHDLDLVRQALGYQRIHLRGGSYGTRLALEYVRQHPDHAGQVVLDGVATPDLDLVGESVRTFELGVDLLVEECAADADCSELVPDLGDALQTRREQLGDRPRRITYDGYPYEEDEDLFLQFLSAFLHTSMWRYRIPRALADALDGETRLWNRLMSEASGAVIDDDVRRQKGGREAPFDLRPRPTHALARSYVAPGLFMNVICAEWMPNAGGIERLEALVDEAEWGDSDRVMWARVCEEWPVTPVDEELRQPVRSDLPMLLVSGEHDLNTPPAWADRAMETLPSAIHLVVPRATHSTMQVPCAAGIMTDWFLEDGDAERVDKTCLEEIPHPGW